MGGWEYLWLIFNTFTKYIWVKSSENQRATDVRSLLPTKILWGPCKENEFTKDIKYYIYIILILVCYKLFFNSYRWLKSLFFCLGQNSNLKQPIVPHFLLLTDVAKGCCGCMEQSSRAFEYKASLALEDYGQADGRKPLGLWALGIPLPRIKGRNSALDSRKTFT